MKGLDLKQKMGSGEGSGEAAAARDLIIHTVLEVINATRLGHAEGTIARHTDGRVAKCYYDRNFNELRWIVLENEHHGALALERVDGLWMVMHEQPWTITPKYSSDPLPI